MSNQNPNPETPEPGTWQRLTPETVFKTGEYYVVLTRMHEPFVTKWYPGRRGGLIVAGHGDGEFSGRHGDEPAVYYCQLPPITEAMYPEIGGMAVAYVRDGRSGALEADVLRRQAQYDALVPKRAEPGT
jgi:hypothetical protein